MIRIWSEYGLIATSVSYWLILRSEEAGVLSLGVERGQPAHQVLDELTSREGLKPLEYQGNLISVDSPMRSLERNLQGACVLLVADAVISALGLRVRKPLGRRAMRAQSVSARSTLSLPLNTPIVGIDG